MIGERGCQAVDPLCVSGPNGCDETFTDLARKFPTARGPPTPLECGILSPGRHSHRADCNSRQT
jgi:hypothetical protein